MGTDLNKTVGALLIGTLLTTAYVIVPVVLCAAHIASEGSVSRPCRLIYGTAITPEIQG